MGHIYIVHSYSKQNKPFGYAAQSGTIHILICFSRTSKVTVNCVAGLYTLKLHYFDVTIYERYSVGSVYE